VTAWILRFDAPPGASPRVAIKDAIDLAGTVTTAGSPSVRERARPALRDAECLAGIRAAGVPIVGKTTLTELCLSPIGINRSFGTPANPRWPDRIPGGSSSGSAVALAGGEADIALGTDTGGSVRIPAACCGVVGLKTTWGRVPTAGVWPLAPTLDTVGPLGRDVALVISGMALLAPGFRPSSPAAVVGRLRIDGVSSDLEASVDAALAGLAVQEVRLQGWASTYDAFQTILLAEFWAAHHDLLDAPGNGAAVDRSLRAGAAIDADALAAAASARRAWQDELAAVFERVDVLALPTLPAPPPRLDEARGYPATLLTSPFNLAGVPALSLPLPGPLPASLQLVGPAGGEEMLCATGLLIEAAQP
jgi:amidase